MKRLLCVLATGVALASSTHASEASEAKPSSAPQARPLAAHAQETLASKPTRDFQKSLRSWDLEATPEINVRLHEITGTVPLHFHADAQERVFLVEGEVVMTLGDEKVTLKPGDYVSIPKGVPHKVELAKGTQRALAAGFMIPAPDPKQTTWVEPAPKPAVAK